MRCDAKEGENQFLKLPQLLLYDIFFCVVILLFTFCQLNKTFSPDQLHENFFLFAQQIRA